jgi:hypothetical protein
MPFAREEQLNETLESLKKHSEFGALLQRFCLTDHLR